MKITYEFDPYEDREQLKLHQNVNEMHSTLIEIYDLVRNELKHGDEEFSDHIEDLLSDIQQKAAIAYE